MNNEREAICVGPCKCGGYGIVYNEQAEKEMGRCHTNLDDAQRRLDPIPDVLLHQKESEMSNDKMREALQLAHDHMRLHIPMYSPGWNVHDTVVSALQSQVSNTPQDGWKLVPVEPTEEMKEAGGRLLQITSLPERESTAVYGAMIAAAPTPPQQQESGEAVAIGDGKVAYIDRVKNAEMLAETYRRQCEGITIQYANLRRMIENGDLVYRDKLPPDFPEELKAQVRAESQAGTTQEAVEFEAREIGEGEWFRVGLDEKERIAAYIASPQMDYRWLYAAPPQVDAAVEAFRKAAVAVCADKQRKLANLFDTAIDCGDEKYIRVYEAQASTAMALYEAIRALPGSTKALEDFGYLVARAVEYAPAPKVDTGFTDDELRAIVQAAIKGEGK